MPMVGQILQTSEDQMCVRNAAGLIGDAANTLGIGISAYMPQFVDSLLNILVSNECQFEAKIHCIRSLGDVCLVSGQHFSPYLDKTITSLASAAELSFDTQDKD
mmetsp:Transcript_5251/g.3971  ORF Transcript_5251/g.3971 Transcript_5251/m.3971 type:complete len:104 (-) Transcript_5251:407-718(-)